MAVIGAGMGGLVGLLISFLGAGNLALYAGAAIGALVFFSALGKPGR